MRDASGGGVGFGAGRSAAVAKSHSHPAGGGKRLALNIPLQFGNLSLQELSRTDHIVRVTKVTKVRTARRALFNRVS